MNNEELLKLIKSNFKVIVNYFPYPTYGSGDDIAETDNHNGKEYDQDLKNLVNLTVQLGAAAADYRNDNKTGVELEVDGIDFPIFMYKFDGKYTITKGLRPKSTPVKIRWRIEY